MVNFTVPDEDKKWEMKCTAHVRGASVHLDLRMEIEKKRLLHGWTINLIKSILAELILKHSTEEEFKNALKKDVLKGKSWKEYLQSVIEDSTFKLKDELSNALEDKYKTEMGKKTVDMKFEEIKEIIEPYRERLKEFFSNPNNKALCEMKAIQTYEWIEAEGRVEPGETGATATLPGFFVVLDSGTVEYGAQKTYYHEYWLHGKVLSGRFVWRLLARTKKWAKAGRERQVWMCWRTKDTEVPYVLSRRAIEREWMPPEGKSALPKHIRDQIPEHYEYWREKGAKAQWIRKQLVLALKRKEVPLKLITEQKQTRFQVKRLWWKGPVVIRGMPQIFYVLLFHNGTVNSAWHFTINPIGRKEILQTVQLEKEAADDKLILDTGALPPKHPLNPNRKLDLNYETLDSGTAQLIAEEDGIFYRYRLEGEKMKGYFVLQRQSPTANLWFWKPSEPPKAKEEATPLFTGRTQFVLHRHYSPSFREHWDIRILVGKELLEFSMYKNPIEMRVDEEVPSDRKFCGDLSWFILDGVNIKKRVDEVDSAIDVLDKGTVDVVSNSKEQTNMLLMGEKLQGMFQWRKERGTIVRLSTSPGAPVASKEVKYAPVSPSGKKLGKEVQPRVIADSFTEPIILEKGFVFIANPDRATEGDIDIILRGPVYLEKEVDLEKLTREELIALAEYYRNQASLFHEWYNRPVTFRLYRAVRAYHPELEERIHFTWDFRGPFTSHMDVYDLALIPSMQPIIRMSRQEVEKLIRESFQWAKRYNIEKSTEDALWIRGQALLPGESLNQRVYSVEEIKKMARTAIGKPIMVNHGEPPYENLRRGVIEDAEEEEGVLEFIGRITHKEWIDKIKNMKPEERLLSIGASPREIKKVDGTEYPEGLVIDEISIIVPPAKPGVPEASYQILQQVDGKEWK